MVEDTPDASADDARAKAEARRKRILEKANKRMGVVSGEHAQGEDEKKQSTSNAARIRAARRRYGKKTQQTSQKQEGEEVAEDKPASPETTEDAEPSAAKEAPANETADAGTSDTTPAAKADDEKSGEAAVESGEATPKEDDGPKKKPMGVARMRRKMLLKKKAAEGQETANVQSSRGATVVEAEPVKPTITKERAVPIFMYTVTIILLFLAGFDFGLQQYHGQVVVHEDLAMRDLGSLFAPKASPVESLSDSVLFDQGSGLGAGAEANEDEFQDEPIVEDEPEIDPLFGVDLDDLTKGPGLLYFFARGAVIAHRFLLRLFYYGPRSFIRTILEIPGALLQTPPTLCFVALLVRQLIGKGILKARIPAPESDDKDSGIDVLSMVKNGVTNFLSSTFPTAVGVYSAFLHVRSDMYVIIFGAICGMVWADSLSRSVGGTSIFEAEEVEEVNTEYVEEVTTEYVDEMATEL